MGNVFLVKNVCCSKIHTQINMNKLMYFSEMVQKVDSSIFGCLVLLYINKYLSHPKPVCQINTNYLTQNQVIPCTNEYQENITYTGAHPEHSDQNQCIKAHSQICLIRNLNRNHHVQQWKLCPLRSTVHYLYQLDGL